MSELGEFPGSEIVRPYPKIAGPFKRTIEPGSSNHNKLKIGEWSESAFATLQNAPWRWTEKLDGTNIRIHWDGYRVSVAGRTDRAQLAGDLLEWIQTNLPEELFEQKFGEQAVTLYGEGLGAGIQKVGSLYSPTKKFVLFDVLIDGVWRTDDTITDAADAFGIERAVNFGVFDVWKAIEIVRKGVFSEYGDFFSEGLVGVPVDGFLNYRGGRIMIKIKTVDFMTEEK